MTTRQFAAKYGIKLRSNPSLSPLGKVIDQYQIEHRLSQQEFADKAGIDRLTLRHVCSGSKKFYDVNVIAGIQKVLEGT